jgi:HSP20 family molecular chaperone IbpA
VEVQGDATEASYEQGILSLKLPKAEHLRPKSIKVNVGK